MKVGAALLAVFVAIATSACCVFGPCDRVSILAGRVSTADGAAVVGAKITAYGHDATTDRNGCFRVGGIEVGAHQLAIVAQGFQPLTVPAKSGMYQVTAIVVPQNSSGKGTVEWSESREGPPAVVPGCS